MTDNTNPFQRNLKGEVNRKSENVLKEANYGSQEHNKRSKERQLWIAEFLQQDKTEALCAGTLY